MKYQIRIKGATYSTMSKFEDHCRIFDLEYQWMPNVKSNGNQGRWMVYNLTEEDLSVMILTFSNLVYLEYDNHDRPIYTVPLVEDLFWIENLT